MRIVNWDNVEVAENPHGVDVRRLFSTKDAQIIHIALKPGERLRRHITPVDAIFYVLEGKGIVEIGDEKREVKKDTLIESPSGIPHCWYNESDGMLRFLVIKVPAPKEPSRLL